MVDFPVYGFDMTPHLANKHNTNNHLNQNNMTEHHHQNSVILGNGWSPWKRSRKQSNNNDNMYDLYAVCYHHGTDLETGHYTAACKNPYDNQWYLYDDAKVTNLSQQSDDVTAELVNNSAYILFYQRRCGVYVGSSSNSSSAASTSSMGSGGDHWVSRMPKFTLPKSVKNVEKKPVKVVENEQPNKIAAVETTTETESEQKVEDAVTLRNSQNALYNSNNSLRKSLETKATNTTTTEENVNNSTENVKRYTTSIYINSSGKADIKTTCHQDDDDGSSSSPVLSGHRVNGLSEQDVTVRLDNKNDKIYRTTAAVHRYSDAPEEKRYHSDGGTVAARMNWVSFRDICPFYTFSETL